MVRVRDRDRIRVKVMVLAKVRDWYNFSACNRDINILCTHLVSE